MIHTGKNDSPLGFNKEHFLYKSKKRKKAAEVRSGTLYKLERQETKII